MKRSMCVFCALLLMVNLLAAIGWAEGGSVAVSAALPQAVFAKGEIEAAALSLKGVHEAVCMYVADRQRIDLFYTGPAQPWDLVVGLKVKLPGYMTPNRTEQRSELPHLPNGKIDRRAIEQKEYGK